MNVIAHIVTCVYCKKRFDRDKIPTVQVSTKRYAHQTCATSEDEKQKTIYHDKLQLEEYIMKLFNLEYVTPRIQKQISKYVEEYHYTYSGIYKALVYWYEIKHNTIDEANGGIGIVPYIYQDSYNYYYALWLAQEANKDKKIEDYIPQTKTIIIKPPERKIKKRKLFTFLDIEEDNS